jgi:hypothetical protein
MFATGWASALTFSTVNRHADQILASVKRRDLVFGDWASAAIFVPLRIWMANAAVDTRTHHGSKVTRSTHRLRLLLSPTMLVLITDFRFRFSGPPAIFFLSLIGIQGLSPFA